MRALRLMRASSYGVIAFAVFGGAPLALAQNAATPPGAASSTNSPDLPGASGKESSSAPATPAAPVAAAGEIVVTAQRRNERLSTVPVAVSAVSASQLRQLNVTTTEDLAHVVPSLQATVSAQSGAPVYTLRGVTFNTANITSTAPVGIYVDQVAYPYPYMAVGEVFDLERVEALKGPQGTLYGRNTTGGLIDYVPAKPTNDPHASLTAGYGNYDSWQISGFVSGPILNNLKGRFAWDSENRDSDWQYSVTRDDGLGVLHRNSVRGILDWQPISKLDVELSANYWHRTGDTQAAQAIASTDASPSAAVLASVIPHPTNDNEADWTPRSDQPFSGANGIIRPPDHTNSNFYGLALRATYKLADHINLVSLSSYNRLDFYQFQDPAGVQTEQVDVANQGTIGSVAQELRLVGDYDRFNWSVGGYYANDRTAEYIQGFAGESPTIDQLKGLALSVPSAYTPEQLEDSYRDFGAHGLADDRVGSAFANLQYSILPTLKLGLGGRYTNDTIHYTGAQFDQDGQEVPLVNATYPILLGHSLAPLVVNGSQTLNATDTGFAVATETQSQDNFAWRAVLDWTPDSRSLYYASVTRGYKSGVFPILNASAIDQLAPVSQEQLTAYELGEKLGFFGRRLQVNSSFFYYDYKNHQVFGQIPDLIFGTLPAVVNVPKSSIYGIDGEIDYAITPTLTATFSGSILRAQVQDFTGSDPFGAVHDYSGAPLPFAPKYSAYSSINKDFRLNDRFDLQASFNGSFQSTSYSYVGSEQQFRIAPYYLFGSNVTLGDDKTHTHFSLYAQNLFNTYYWTSAQLSHNTIVRYAGMPQTYGFRVSWDY